MAIIFISIYEYLNADFLKEKSNKNNISGLKEKTFFYSNSFDILLERNIHDIVAPLFNQKFMWNPKLQPQAKHLKFIFNVLRGHLPSISEIIALDAIITHVLFTSNPVLFAEVRALLQELLLDRHQQLSNTF